MSQQLDTQGEAHEALGTAVASYGHRVLSDPHTLGNLVADLLPDLPRERSLLVTGAEAGVAAEMRQHVEEQHIDPDTAVQLMARALSERRAIDPAASTWVASEYAQALGYQVRPYTAGKAALRLAIAIGRDAQSAALDRFIGDPGVPVLVADSSEDIAERLVAVSLAVSRMSGAGADRGAVARRLFGAPGDVPSKIFDQDTIV